eukprot:COSAG04_NODE_45_length_31617_cov_47.863284_2_plen_164_part_00
MLSIVFSPVASAPSTRVMPGSYSYQVVASAGSMRRKLQMSATTASTVDAGADHDEAVALPLRLHLVRDQLPVARGEGGAWVGGRAALAGEVRANPGEALHGTEAAYGRRVVGVGGWVGGAASGLLQEKKALAALLLCPPPPRTPHSHRPRVPCMPVHYNAALL